MFKMINAGIFPFEIYVGYGISHKQFLTDLKEQNVSKELIKQLGVEQDDDRSTADQGYCFNNDGTNYVWTAIQSPAILAHELLHATFNVLEDVDIAYNDDNQEVYTYLLQYLMQQILTTTT